jgi:molybdopterin-guanine dinucleotide biosynthesis protein A
MIDNISGIILAGGVNSRFNGIVKANIVIGGRSIISRTSDILREIFSELIIVTNTPSDFAEYTDFRIVTDEIPDKGPLGGIHAALKAVSGEAAFVFAGDMPLIDKEIIIRLLNSFSVDMHDAIIPKTDNYIEPLHAIYSKSILSDIEVYLTTTPKNAVREFLKQVNTYYLPMENSEKIRKAFTNINYPEDLQALEKQMRIY